MANAAPRPRNQSVKSIFTRYVPLVGWLPKYKKEWLRPDLMAALTIWALLVPEGMAYATIAGVPPEAGLYAAPLAMLAYAIFGTSRHLTVGPSSTVAVLSAAIVGFYAVSGSESYITMSAALAILTGFVLLISGILRLGVLADFLSKPVLGGFVIGLAISIAMGQLDKIVGYQPVEYKFIPDILLYVLNIGKIHWITFIVGGGSLALLFVLDRFPKIPGAITVVALAIVLSGLLGLESYGVHIVGNIPGGLPPIGLPGGLTLREILGLIPGAIAIALVGFAESVAAARSYATKYGYEIDANQEMVALGVSNMGSGLSSGFVVDGSLSRSAAADESGSKSQMMNLLGAVMVLITAVFLTPLFYYLPEATLGAIVIHAVWHLINFHKLRRYREIKALDFWAAVLAMVGVLAFGILAGLILAVLLSLLGLLVQAKNPNWAVLGKHPEFDAYVDIANNPTAKTVPGLLLFRWDDQVFFANAPNFRSAVRFAVGANPDTTALLIDAAAIHDLDVTAVDMFAELNNELTGSGITLGFAEMHMNVRAYLKRANIEDAIGLNHFYQTIQMGVDAYLAEKRR